MKTTRHLPCLVLASLLSLSSWPDALQGAPGQVSTFQKISSTQGGFGGALSDGDQFGAALALIGDVNGDGFPDLAVGAPGDDTGGTNRGALWILFLDELGRPSEWQKISDTDGFFVAELRDQDHFGASVVPLGDLSNDGSVEIAVGAPGDDGAGSDRGAIYILTLDPIGTVDRFVQIDSTTGGFAGGLDDGDLLGVSLATVGDLDGDLLNEVVVGASGDDDGGPSRGAAWVVFLESDGTVRSLQKISDTVGSFDGLLADFDQFGNSLAALGLVNADPVPDLVVGAYGDDDGGPSHGAVWVLFLTTEGSVSGYQKISSAAGGFTGVLQNGDAFGVSVAGIEDVDGDTRNDIAVGVLRDSDGGPQRGAVWIVFVDEGGTVRGQTKISSTAGNFAAGLDDFDHFGFGVGRLGDLDQDDATDLIVGAPDDDDGGLDRGAIYTLFLEGRFLAATSPRLGSGSNSECFDIVGVPRIGTSWSILALGTIGTTALIGQSEPLATPIQLSFGELLIDLLATNYYVDTSMNGTHALPVPNLASLAGVVVYSQGLRLGPLQLCNAWDATIGF